KKSGYQDNELIESHFHLKLLSLYLESELLTWSTSPFFRHAFRRVAYIRGLSGWRGPPTPAQERSPALALATSSSTASALPSLTAFEYPLQISKLLGKDIRLGLERSFEFFERHWRRSQDEAKDADVGFDPN